MENKVLFLGELLIRHTPVNTTTWENGCQTQIFFGGSEANIAVTLATLEIPTKIFSALPSHNMGKLVQRYFTQQNVDMTDIVWKGERVGQYYATRGIGMRAGEVVYDRANSSFISLTEDDIDFTSVFAGITHFHVSGITIALGEHIQKLTLAMLAYAQNKGITISIDLNYRGKLWDFQTAKETMAKFLGYADICFGIEPVAAIVGEQAVFPQQQATQAMIQERMELLRTRFGLRQIFHTVRKVDCGNINHFQAYALSEEGFFESDILDTFIVERVGSGDAFASGILYGLIQELPLQDTINFGTYLATIKCTEYGDHLKTSPEIVSEFLANEHQGIKR